MSQIKLQDQGASANADRATHERSRVSPSPPSRVSVPSADALVRLMSAWGSLPGHKFHAAYPFFDPDRQRIIEEYGLSNDDRANLEATALLFAEYADDLYASGMEARRAAAENTDAVHDSPTAATSSGDAQQQDSTP